MFKLYSLCLLILLAALLADLHSSPAMRASAQIADQTIGPMSDGTLRRIDVPILMYHYVSELPEDADAYRIDLTVSPVLFRQHLEYLRDVGYESIGLADLHLALLQGDPLPDRPIILTFDDGYIDHYRVVFPLLLEFGYRGTFFVISGRADDGDPAYLSWQQIQEMAAAGMSIEAHTKTHPDLRGQEHAFLIYEIVGSVQSIEAHVGSPVRMFAYPAGRYDDRVLRILETTNLWRAVTTRHGLLHTTDNRLMLDRLRVSNSTGVLGLQHLLNAPANGRE